MARGGNLGDHNGLSPSEGEDLSLCGFCLSMDIAETNPIGGATNGELRARCDCLSMFVRRMLRVMSMNSLGDREVFRQASRYIKAIGATGSILRDDDIQEQSRSGRGEG